MNRFTITQGIYFVLAIILLSFAVAIALLAAGYSDDSFSSIIRSFLFKDIYFTIPAIITLVVGLLLFIKSKVIWYSSLIIPFVGLLFLGYKVYETISVGGIEFIFSMIILSLMIGAPLILLIYFTFKDIKNI